MSKALFVGAMVLMIAALRAPHAAAQAVGPNNHPVGGPAGIDADAANLRVNFTPSKVGVPIGTTKTTSAVIAPADNPAAGNIVYDTADHTIATVAAGNPQNGAATITVTGVKSGITYLTATNNGVAVGKGEIIVVDIESVGAATNKIGDGQPLPIYCQLVPTYAESLQLGLPTWSITQRPDNSHANVPAPGTSVQFTPDLVGTYQLTATCGATTKPVTFTAVRMTYSPDPALVVPNNSVTHLNSYKGPINYSYAAKDTDTMQEEGAGMVIPLPFPGNGPYISTVNINGDAKFGKENPQDHILVQGLVVNEFGMYVGDNWDGTPIQVTASTVDNGAVDVKDMAMGTTWTFDKTNKLPWTTITQSEGPPLGEWRDSPVKYTYTVGPDAAPAYDGDFATEEFEHPVADFTLDDLTYDFKKAHPDMTLPEITDFLTGDTHTLIGSSRINDANTFIDTLDSFSPIQAFTFEALTRGITVSKAQHIKNDVGTTIITYALDLKISLDADGNHAHLQGRKR